MANINKRKRQQKTWRSVAKKLISGVNVVINEKAKIIMLNGSEISVKMKISINNVNNGGA